MLGRNKGITEQLDVVKLENDPSSVLRGHGARDDHEPYLTDSYNYPINYF